MKACNRKIIIIGFLLLISSQFILAQPGTDPVSSNTTPSSTTASDITPADPNTPSSTTPSDITPADPNTPSSTTPSDITPADPNTPSSTTPITPIPTDPSQVTPSPSGDQPIPPSSDIKPNDPNIIINPTDKPEAPYKDILYISIYNSSLTSVQRDEYLFWVKFKNSFAVNMGQLSKIAKYFEPESPSYYKTIFTHGWPFYLLAALFTLALLMYLIMRFMCGMFQGPKQHVTRWLGFFSLFLMLTGFSLCLIFFGFSLSNNSKIYAAVSNVTDYAEEQAEMLRITALKLEGDQIELASRNYTTNVSEFKTEIYKYEEIKNETLAYAEKLEDFSGEVFDNESLRFSYEIACIVLIPLFTIGVLVFYKCRKSCMILILSTILFALIIPACVIMGLNTSFFLLSIDLCKDMNKYITSKVSPIAEKGFGVYISCPSKPTQVMINTAKYELGTSFNKIIEELNNTLITSFKDTVGVYKRNNTHFKYLADSKYVNETNIANGLYTLFYTNNILQGLSALSQCQVANSVFNYVEEGFCYQNISYQFSNLFYYFIGIAGLFLLSVGSNKLTVLLSPAYQKLDSKNEMELLDESS